MDIRGDGSANIFGRLMNKDMACSLKREKYFCVITHQSCELASTVIK